jgi:hypothetical protein
MKSKVLLLIIMGLFVFSMALLAIEQAKSTSKPVAKEATTTYMGYLCDTRCGSAGIDPAKDDLTKYPGKHTVACMKTPGCMDSGFGMFIKNDKGVYVYHKFDSKGSDLAKFAIKKTPQKKDVKVVVKGKMEPNGEIMVASFNVQKAMTKAKTAVKK